MEFAQISDELKISTRMLEAIEEEKFERLPGGIITKSFVRQYARVLGLDEQELAAELQRLMESPFAIQTLLEAEPAANAAPPIHVPRVEAWERLGEKRFSWSSWMLAVAMVIVVMLVCSGIYARWQGSHRDATAPQPNASKAEARRDSPPPAGQQQPPAAVPPIVPAAEVPARPVAAVAELPAAAPVDQASTTPSNPNAAVRVALTAKARVWVSARADGKMLFSGMLTTNETRTVEAHDILLLRVGNAGVISVTLNGKSLGALGARGQTRTVQFTSGGFQTVAASRSSLPL